jgi:acyl-CoA synthetase (AMP-forming)/AMP-acid ligase II
MQSSHRRKKEVIRGGENVYPAQIENLLLQHPKVKRKEVAVVGAPHPKWEEVRAAAAALHAGQNADPAEFSSFLQGKIAEFKIPQPFHFVESLPATVSHLS